MLNSYEAIYEQGLIKWVDEVPPVVSARVIVTILSAANEPGKTICRKPSPLIAGKGMILGDIMSPVVPEEDWDALR